MAEKNIQMQRKTATGYDKYYPKTKVELVAGAAKQADLESHLVDDASQVGGVHGLRIQNEKLQYFEGGEWKTTSPVQILEEVIDFNEAGITLTHDNTEIVDGSLQLSDTNTTGSAIIQWNEQPQNIKAWDLATYQNTLDGETVTVDIESVGDLSVGTTVDRPEDTDANSTWNDMRGVLVKPNKNINGLRVTISANSSGYTKARLIKHDTGDILQEKDVSSLMAGENFTFEYKLEMNEEYRVVLYADGNTYTIGYNSSTSFPYQSTDIDIINGIGGNNAVPTVFNIVSVTALYYDWQTAFLDISQNFDISTIDPSNQVRLKVNLSRTDINNNPSCDYLARRFVR